MDCNLKKSIFNLYITVKILFILTIIWEFFITVYPLSLRAVVWSTKVLVPFIPLLGPVWAGLVIGLSILVIYEIFTRELKIAAGKCLLYGIFSVYCVLTAAAIMNPYITIPALAAFLSTAAWAMCLLYFRKIVSATQLEEDD